MLCLLICAYFSYGVIISFLGVVTFVCLALFLDFAGMSSDIPILSQSATSAVHALSAFDFA